MPIKALEAALAKEGITPDRQWALKVIGSIVKLLKQDPLRYRTYGHYWWPLKKLLAQEGHYFGEDEGPVLGVLYDDTAHLLVAAIMLSNQRLLNGHAADNIFHIQRADGEVLQYVLEDADMEALVLGRRVHV
ncbi:MAG: hypothetical protein H7A08_05845 [Oceanospirillaceae bacterium]|nr:hypothetical protein [Oceanospirillaceae bacterium]